MPAPLLVIAIGNESRGDDALGPLLLRRLQQEVADTTVEFIEEFQLQVENSLDLQGRTLVLFLDAGKNTASPFSFYPAKQRRMEGHTSHAIAPEELLGVYAAVTGEVPPPAYVLCVAGESFELGEALSEAATRHLETAAGFAIPLLKNPTPEFWGSPLQAPQFTKAANSTHFQ